MTEDVIAQLGQSLRGPRRAKQRLLAETDLGLSDAVQAYVDAGCEASFATARALADFGTVPQIRAHFQAELDVVNARRVARLSVLLLPLQTLFWNVVWELNPYPAWQAPSLPFLIAATASIFALLTALPAAAALVVTGRYGQGKGWTGMNRGESRLLAGTCAFAVTVLTLPTIDPITLLWPPTIAAVMTALVLLTATIFIRPPHRAGSAG